jgi:hypothetical protein
LTTGGFAPARRLVVFVVAPVFMHQIAAFFYVAALARGN